tara:strand:+ start:57 stop:383 length:327 start_codon:yes stop_codon:yes gene_type:complete
MKLEAGKFCPLINKDCIGLECAWFTQVRGMNPQTGEQIDEWDCAVKWVPMMLIENTQMQRQTGAAIESFRNESVKVSLQAQEIYKEELNQKLSQPREMKNISAGVEND